MDDLPPAIEQALKSYVEWNTLTRHQLIVAHMTSVRGWAERKAELAKLYTEACEVVRHDADCAGFGKGDEHCNCGAVAFLAKLEAFTR